MPKEIFLLEIFFSSKLQLAIRYAGFPSSDRRIWYMIREKESISYYTMAHDENIPRKTRKTLSKYENAQ
jgi:hypothetical protein